MSENKSTKLSALLQTMNVEEIEKISGNPYESIVIISKRANQINAMMTEELREKLQEFSMSTDNLEEIQENAEQIEISKYYERLPKPNLLAYQEFLDGQIYFRNPDKEEEEKSAEG
ncbi:MAG: DNA-directed RNA polymerase subunit omega [Bacteroidetes bacterium]|nr:DNA-directed RNA polymerase subunit omega [Bacteroidota bacterium]